MVAFPAFSAVVSLICAALVGRDAVRRPRPDKIAWAIAFAIFAIAAGCEVVAAAFEWSPTLARIYYLTGAVLVVGYLALGELYLLAGLRIQRFAPGVTLLVTAAAATIVMNAGVDSTRLQKDGWEAIDRGDALVALAISINSLGTLVIVGGLAYSAWKFKRLGVQRNRMIGCLLIAVGTLSVGLGGTLTRFGHREYLYIPMAIGSAIIFAGYLYTRKPDGSAAVILAPTSAEPRTPPRPVVKVPDAPQPEQAGSNPLFATQTGLAFVESKLMTMSAEEISDLARIWSVPATGATEFERAAAKRAWSLRAMLSPAAQERFDTLPVSVRLQLTDAYHEVFSIT